MSKLQRIGDDQTQIEQLPATDRHDLLANERRRTALAVLADQTTPIWVEDLALLLLQRESEHGDVEMENIDRVVVSLHHSHLPKMDELGAVDYDPESKTVRSDLNH